jgi:hypothetical protein
MKALGVVGVVTVIISFLPVFVGCQSKTDTLTVQCRKTLADEAGTWDVMISIDGGTEVAGQELSLWSSANHSLNRRVFKLTTLLLTEDITEASGGQYTSTVTGSDYQRADLSGSCARNSGANTDTRTMTSTPGGPYSEHRWTGNVREYDKFGLERTRPEQMEVINIRYVGHVNDNVTPKGK